MRNPRIRCSEPEVTELGILFADLSGKDQVIASAEILNPQMQKFVKQKWNLKSDLVVILKTEEELVRETRGKPRAAEED